MISLFTRAAELQFRRSSPHLFFKLFDTLVKPVASYGCSIWATNLTSLQDAAHNTLERIHTSFMRHYWGLRQYVSPWIMYSEHDRQPMLTSWWGQILRFWNMATQAPPTALFKMVFAQNLGDARAGLTSNWASGVLRFIQMLRRGFKLDCPAPTLSTKEHIVLYKKFLWSSVNSMAVDGSMVRLHTYYSLFKPFKGSISLRAVPPTVRFSDLATLMRFRSGCHDLLVEQGRWHNVPRPDRLCTLCRTAVQDEHHITFDCAALSDLRRKFACLFRHSTMRSFYNYNMIGPLAAFLRECLQRANPIVTHSRCRLEVV